MCCLFAKLDKVCNVVDFAIVIGLFPPKEKDQVQDLKELCLKFDEDQDGYISQEELDDMISTIRYIRQAMHDESLQTIADVYVCQR